MVATTSICWRSFLTSLLATIAKTSHSITNRGSCGLIFAKLKELYSSGEHNKVAFGTVN